MQMKIVGVISHFHWGRRSCLIEQLLFPSWELGNFWKDKYSAGLELGLCKPQLEHEFQELVFLNEIEKITQQNG